MTEDEALEVFGLTEAEHDPEILRILRGQLSLEAGDTNSEARLKINLAYDILRGAAEAESPAARAASPGATSYGHTLARCTTHPDMYFGIYWEHFPGLGREIASGKTIDLVSFQRGVRLTYRPDERAFYAGKGYEPITAQSPLDGKGSGWRSDFNAEVRVHGGLCPHCNAPHTLWCENCGVPFCHQNSTHYTNRQLECPTCKTPYSFTPRDQNTKDQKIEDGKILRGISNAPNTLKRLK